MAKEETTTTTCTCGGRCICNSKHRVLYALGGLVILGLLLGTVFACGVKMGQHRQDFGRDDFGRGSMMMRGGFRATTQLAVRVKCVAAQSAKLLL